MTNKTSKEQPPHPRRPQWSDLVRAQSYPLKVVLHIVQGLCVVVGFTLAIMGQWVAVSMGLALAFALISFVWQVDPRMITTTITLGGNGPRTWLAAFCSDYALSALVAVVAFGGALMTGVGSVTQPFFWWSWCFMPAFVNCGALLGKQLAALDEDSFNGPPAMILIPTIVISAASAIPATPLWAMVSYLVAWLLLNVGLVVWLWARVRKNQHNPQFWSGL